jgi:beta-glucosidase
MTIMESYTEYDGVPNMANRNSLETMLRQDLGFDGMLVTDYQEIENLIGFHKVAIDINEAVKLALLETSVDMSMLPFNIEGWVNGVRTSLSDDMIEDAVKDRIDRSVMRILRLKDELDMFDTDLTEGIDEFKNIWNMSTRAVALNIARDSIVLTKNTDKTLPLPKSRRRKKLKIHVTGPTSNSIRYQSGGWTVEWQGASSDEQFTYGQTVLQATTEKTKWQVTSSCGVNIVGDPCDGNITETANQQRSAADYIFVCIGEENYTGECPLLASSLSLAVSNPITCK